MLESLIPAIRAQFPALNRRVGDRPAVFFDGPAGSQVPRGVIDAIGHYLSTCNANHGGLFATSLESDQLLHQTHQAVADFLGADDPDCIVFGANMTTLTFAISRALSKNWRPGDRIVVTRLDHDANVSPWVLAARDANCRVEFIEFRSSDCTLDMDDVRRKLAAPTRLLALGCASNATGTINRVAEIGRLAKLVGAHVYLDAVHYAPHALIDVEKFGCDFLACSAYKFFGPHIGVLWGKRDLLESLNAYKVEPAPDKIPDKWMTGTQNHECLAGVLAAVDYLASLGRDCAGDPGMPRRDALRSAYSAIVAYEQRLLAQLIRGLAEIPGIRIHGITATDQLSERLPTVAITHDRILTSKLAASLGSRGIFVWHGNYYALQLTRTLGLEPEGMVRIGLLHYNTSEEVDRFLSELRSIVDSL